MTVRKRFVLALLGLILVLGLVRLGVYWWEQPTGLTALGRAAAAILARLPRSVRESGKSHPTTTSVVLVPGAGPRPPSPVRPSKSRPDSPVTTTWSDLRGLPSGALGPASTDPSPATTSPRAFTTARAPTTPS